jgi:hypothetical protein
LIWSWASLPGTFLGISGRLPGKNRSRQHTVALLLELIIWHGARGVNAVTSNETSRLTRIIARTSVSRLRCLKPGSIVLKLKHLCYRSKQKKFGHFSQGENDHGGSNFGRGENRLRPQA